MDRGRGKKFFTRLCSGRAETLVIPLFCRNLPSLFSLILQLKRQPRIGFFARVCFIGRTVNAYLSPLSPAPRFFVTVKRASSRTDILRSWIFEFRRVSVVSRPSKIGEERDRRTRSFHPVFYPIHLVREGGEGARKWLARRILRRYGLTFRVTDSF